MKGRCFMNKAAAVSKSAVCAFALAGMVLFAGCGGGGDSGVRAHGHPVRRKRDERPRADRLRAHEGHRRRLAGRDAVNDVERGVHLPAVGVYVEDNQRAIVIILQKSQPQTTRHCGLGPQSP